ncbi:MAG: tRNA uracil 4-sulfurtransferase ThiI [Succinivibrionaceae bacterium]|nr:tRNA uracil 4-sulfurtransferase ThiI [Succinivibrionaceae bacterium]
MEEKDIPGQEEAEAQAEAASKEETASVMEGQAETETAAVGKAPAEAGAESDAEKGIDESKYSTFIIKLFPEIVVKSKPVRTRMIRILTGNIRNVFQNSGIRVKVLGNWDRVFVKVPKEVSNETSSDILSRIPGIHSFSEVLSFPYTSLDDILRTAAPLAMPEITGKTFCVRCKRKGQETFTSVELERALGEVLWESGKSAGVSLKKPQITIHIEVDGKKFYLLSNTRKGIGGYPLSTQEDVLSLISGGFDSGVSSFDFIRRGARVHYCFFNMGGREHEIGVREEAHFIWKKYGSSHRVKFFAVPFEDVVGEILQKIDHHLMGVVLKRMMMRAAAKIAEREGIKALVTGESVGQVSSQTITNLSVIDRVTPVLILRPLITMDKQDIIDKCREIGTEELAAAMPEYCGVISQKPTIHADLGRIEEEEKKFDFSILDKAVEDSRWTDIKEIGEAPKGAEPEVEYVTAAGAGEIVLDVRAPDEAEENPLRLEGAEIKELPFYKIATEFGNLDQTKTYLLYCKNGVMSRLQALILKERGFKNVKVIRI